MARARNIKPGFFKNENLCELQPMDRLLFAGLWCLADREGRLENRPKKIKMELFPCDDYDVPAGIANLERAGFVKAYQVGHFSVIQVVNFLVHQVPHGTEKDSELPDSNGVLTVNRRKANGYITGEIIRVTVEQLLANGVLTVKELFLNTLNPESGILNPESGILNPESGIHSTTPPANVRALFGNPGEPTVGNQRVPFSSDDPSAFTMHINWKPTQDAFEIIRRAHIEIPSPVAIEKTIAEFVSYWKAKATTRRTQADWDHAFSSRVINSGFCVDPSERGFVC